MRSVRASAAGLVVLGQQGLEAGDLALLALLTLGGRLLLLGLLLVLGVVLGVAVPQGLGERAALPVPVERLELLLEVALELSAVLPLERAQVRDLVVELRA